MLNARKKRALFGSYFLYFFLPWSVALALFFSYFYFSETEKIKSIRSQNEDLNVGLGKRSLHQEFQAVESDLLVLAKYHDFLSGNKILSAKELEDLRNDFLVFSSMKKMYDQIRFLDTEGMEIVRVNYRKGEAIVVPEESLQNKKTRYYFKKSFNTARDMVYVSPLDLNVEHGKIEEPYKPMIRFGTPVFNAKDEKTGIVLLNYLAERLLVNFTSAVGNIQDHTMLVNAEGYWLKHPNPDMEWGFMLNHEHNFIARYPEAWKAISLEDHGQFSNNDGMFTFATITPFRSIEPDLQKSDADGARLAENQYQWKIVSYVSRDVVNAQNRLILLMLVKIATPLFLLLMLVSWRLSRARIKDEKAQEELSRAAAVFEAASEGIVITDADNIIQTANSSFTRITGYSVDEVIGKTPAVLKSGRQDEDFYREMWEQLLSSRRWEGEVLNQRKDGTIYSEWLSIVALVDEQNNICNFVALFNDITTKKRNEELLKQQATLDALTGLPNRQLFLDRLSRALLHSKRLETRFALFFIDLDKFKDVNDSLGHTAGDLLLKEVSTRIQNVIRESDTVARLGGDEFTVVLNNIVENQDVARVAQLIIDVVSEPVVLDGQDVIVGASIGIALFPDDGSEQISLLNNADEAMYKAKRDGRNRYSFWGETHG